MRSAARSREPSSSICSSCGGIGNGKRVHSIARAMRFGSNTSIVPRSIEGKQDRDVDVMHQKCRVRGSARQLHLAAGRIDHVSVGIVVLENAANVADVV